MIERVYRLKSARGFHSTKLGKEKSFHILVLPIFAGLVIAGALIALAILHNRGQIDASNTISFLGSATGTAGAVLGAIYVERWKHRYSERRDLRLLTVALGQLLQTLQALGQEPILNDDPKENFEHELLLVDEIRHAMMEADAAMQAVEYGRRSGDAELIVQLHRVQRTISHHLPILTKQIERGTPSQSRMDNRAVELLSAGEDARDALVQTLKDVMKTL